MSDVIIKVIISFKNIQVNMNFNCFLNKLFVLIFLKNSLMSFVIFVNKILLNNLKNS